MFNTVFVLLKVIVLLYIVKIFQEPDLELQWGGNEWLTNQPAPQTQSLRMTMYRCTHTHTFWMFYIVCSCTVYILSIVNLLQSKILIIFSSPGGSQSVAAGAQRSLLPYLLFRQWHTLVSVLFFVVNAFSGNYLCKISVMWVPLSQDAHVRGY